MPLRSLARHSTRILSHSLGATNFYNSTKQVSTPLSPPLSLAAEPLIEGASHGAGQSLPQSQTTGIVTRVGVAPFYLILSCIFQCVFVCYIMVYVVGNVTFVTTNSSQSPNSANFNNEYAIRANSVKLLSVNHAERTLISTSNQNVLMEPAAGSMTIAYRATEIRSQPSYESEHEQLSTSNNIINEGKRTSRRIILPMKTGNVVQVPIRPTNKEYLVSPDSPHQVHHRPKRFIMGIAADIDPMNFAIFCGSARNHMTATEVSIVIFINGAPKPRVNDIAQKFDVLLVEYGIGLNSSLHNNKGQQYDVPKLMEKYHPSTLRWHLYSEYIAKNPSLFGDVRSELLLVDVRDTYFQSNAFESENELYRSSYELNDPNRQRLYTFQEFVDIESCKWNSDWIRDCFGTETLNTIKHSIVLCSGVLMGSLGTIQQYLHIMNDVISGNTGNLRIKDRSQFPQCERNGVDQGVHNVIIHSRAISNVVDLPCEVPLVANLQSNLFLFQQSPFSDGIVHSAFQAATPYPIVHQYDRVDALQQALLRKFVYWIDVSDLSALWKEESECNGFTKYDGLDLLKGRCDLKTGGGATSAASCCRMCASMNTCQGFTYSESKCYLKNCNAVLDIGNELNAGVITAIKARI